MTEGHVGLTLGLKKGMRGAIVQALDPADNAAKAGMQVGWVIIGLNGKRVEHPKTAIAIIRAAAGPTLEVQYVDPEATKGEAEEEGASEVSMAARDEEEASELSTAAKEGASEEVVEEDATENIYSSRKWDKADGVCYIDMTEGHVGLTLGLRKGVGVTLGLKKGVRGAIVQAVDPADNAAKAGMQVGWVIIGLAGKNVDSPKKAIAIINAVAGPTLEVQYVAKRSAKTAGG